MERIELNKIADTLKGKNQAARAKQDNVGLIVALQPWEDSDLPSALCIGKF